jgi:hypothetical protein
MVRMVVVDGTTEEVILVVDGSIKNRTMVS